MRKHIASFMALLLLGSLAAVAQPNHGHGEERGGKERERRASGERNPVTKAICTLTPTEGNTAAGWVKFTREEGGVRVTAEVTGLTPNAKHGFHIHEFGDISAADGTATGGHFNPGGHDHAGPDAEERHAGDFGNIETDENGVGRYDRLDTQIRLGGPTNNIIGRGVIVHAGEDDLTSQPTGDAGARIAQGVVGVAKSE